MTWKGAVHNETRERAHTNGKPYKSYSLQGLVLVRMATANDGAHIVEQILRTRISVCIAQWRGGRCCSQSWRHGSSMAGFVLMAGRAAIALRSRARSCRVRRRRAVVRLRTGVRLRPYLRTASSSAASASTCATVLRREDSTHVTKTMR